MKIEVREDYTIQLEEVFDGVVIKTTDGIEFGICQRDRGIEITCNGVTKHIDEETLNTKEMSKLEKYSVYDIENYLETIGYSIIKTRLEIETKQFLSMLTTKTL